MSAYSDAEMYFWYSYENFCTLVAFTTVLDVYNW